MTRLRIPLSAESAPTVSWLQRTVAAVVLGAGFLWLLTPRLYGSFANQLHKEDGSVFLTDQQRGAALTETYTGYLHVGPRISAEVCATLESNAFAPCVAAASAGTRVAVALLMLTVLLPHLRNYWWALAAACLPVFGSIGQQEVLGNITNLRWFFDVAIVVGLLGLFRRPATAVLATGFVAVATLSDPLAVVAAPLALWRLLTARGWGRTVPAGYIAALAVHLLFLSPSSRPVEWQSIAASPVTFVQNFVIRSLTETLLGESGSQLSVNVLSALPIALATVLAVVVFFACSWRFLATDQRFLVVVLGGSGALFLLATLCFTDPQSVDVALGLSRASRYALAPSVLIGSAVLVVLSRLPRRGPWRVVTCVVVILLVLSAVVDSRGDEWSTRGPSWMSTVERAEQECAAGRSTATVPVTPQGVPTDWTATVNCSWISR